MDQYEIRVNQLKKLKFSLFFKIIFFIVIYIFIDIFLLFIINKTTINWFDIDSNKTTFIFKFIYFFTSILLLLIVVFIMFMVGNSNYKKFYKECIYAECKLEEIYLLDHKVSNNKIVNTFLERMYFLKGIKFISSFSDASSKYSCDINFIKYKMKKSKFGTLFSIHYDQEKPGFIQISHRSRCALETYDNEDIIQYGMPYTSLLRKFRVYSTYGHLTYLLEDNVNGKKIAILEKFFKKDIDIVFDNENLYIFVPNIKINLSDSVLKKISSLKFSNKIESIIEMHSLLFDIIKLFDELFVIN